MKPLTITKRWIAHPADTGNVLLALGAPFLLFAPFALRLPQTYAGIYGIVLFLFIGKANYILHLQIHRPLCRPTWLNRLLELALGAVTSMVASNWRIQHLYGHHRGIDVPYRGDRSWQLEKYTLARAISYSTLSIGGTLLWPWVESFQKGVVANVTAPMSYRWAFAEQSLLFVFVVALAVRNPGLVVWYLLPWYLTTHLITHYVDYLNHYGCDERSENIHARANNSLDAAFNKSTHNFGYHTVHHLRPSAHWTEVPNIHREIAGRIPAVLLKDVSWSGLLIPYHFYLSLRGRM